DDSYTVGIRPMSEADSRNSPHRDNKTEYIIRPCDDGCLRFSHIFHGEQEQYIRIFREGKRLVQLSVFSLHEDLAGRYPFLGDLHVHSARSDGKEAPAVVAANLRRCGYDFTVISDHHRYYPSLEAIEAYKNVSIDMNIVPGEEVHMPNNNVHIVNFGGAYSVNGLIESSPQITERGKSEKYRCLSTDCPPVISQDAYIAEVEAIAAELELPETIERFAYASCIWAFNHIKKSGGLGIFCHPYWISDVYQIPEEFTDYLTEKAPFDAFEVLGGESYFEQNGMQTAKYYDDKEKGRRYPVVGSSDSHGTVNNPNAHVASTIIFAPENTREALIDSVKRHYSVAVDDLVKDIGLVGDFRFVRYGAFLLRNYFPLLAELCYEEGRLMKAYVCGDEASGIELNRLKGRTDKLRRHYFLFD
ncbi:MAG: hypothetical protein PHZ09_14565, partial [Eubacteriales bacterium]|nr:hypothetical protein [Eubacteriales bacterium]